MCTLKYLMVMPDIQKAKCFEFTIQIMANETLLSWFFIKEKLPSEVPFSICHETTVLDKVLKCLSVTLFRGKH